MYIWEGKGVTDTVDGEAERLRAQIEMMKEELTRHQFYKAPFGRNARGFRCYDDFCIGCGARRSAGCAGACWIRRILEAQ